MTSLAAHPTVRFDPTKDKTYRAATLGRHMALIEAGEV